MCSGRYPDAPRWPITSGSAWLPARSGAALAGLSATTPSTDAADRTNALKARITTSLIETPTLVRPRDRALAAD
ncbi:hypothetical protein GCM10023148_28310 [Actinokineospora soli]